MNQNPSWNLCKPDDQEQLNSLLLCSATKCSPPVLLQDQILISINDMQFNLYILCNVFFLILCLPPLKWNYYKNFFVSKTTNSADDQIIIFSTVFHVYSLTIMNNSKCLCKQTTDGSEVDLGLFELWSFW